MRLLFISNGHGEDAIAARLLLALRAHLPQLETVALPLVGAGRAFEGIADEVIGPRRELPAGGLTFHSPALLRADLAAGLLPAVFAQLRAARAVRTDAVLVVGDLWAQAVAQLVRAPRRGRFVVQPLVSVLHAAEGPPHPLRLFMERITLPEQLLLRHRTARAWFRDEATAAWLRERGVDHAVHAGNLLLDEAPPARSPGARQTVLLLPGTRAYAGASLSVMLETARLLPERRFVLPWAAGILQPPAGWTHEPAGAEGGGRLHRDGLAVELLPGGLTAELLAGAHAALGTAGTAHEQAAAAGVPVVAFPMEPHYTGAFLANQKRLLGPALTVARADPAQLAELLADLLADDGAAGRLRAEAAARLGQAGGVPRIAAELGALLAQVRTSVRPGPPR